LRVVNHRELIDLIAAGAQVIDVLPGHEYRACHIRGAIHLPLARVMREAKGLFRPDRPLVVYCRDSL
jgi:rhodanese-related sulfurtransferase